MIQTTSTDISEELMEALQFKYIPHLRMIENYKYPITYKELEMFGKAFNKDIYSFGAIPVFTMSELWDMLPKVINMLDWEYFKTLSHTSVYYWHEDGILEDVYFMDKDNICNALAKLVMWCIENGHKLNLPSK